MLCKYSILYEVLTSPYSIMTVQVGFLAGWYSPLHKFSKFPCNIAEKVTAVKIG